jgi:hypothetical protein
MQPMAYFMYVCVQPAISTDPPREYVLTDYSILYVGLTAGLGIVTLGLNGLLITSPKRSSSLGRAWIFANLAPSA